MDTKTNIPYDVVLAATHEDALAYRKHAVAQGGPRALFGVAVGTFSSWIADLWELHGDGRAIATECQRRAVAIAVCKRDRAVQGAASVVAECLKRASGLREFEEALSQVDAAASGGLSAAERDVLALCAKVRAAYEDLGLVELGEAARIVCERAPKRRARVCVRLARPLTLIEERFLEGIGAEVSVEGEAPSVVSRAPSGVRVRFGFPSGRYAEPALIAGEVSAFLPQGGAVVASKDPLALFMQCEQALSRAGAVCAVRTRVPFPQTDFGRVFFSIRAFLGQETWRPSDLTDFLLSPLSGISSSLAYAIDARVRGDRLIDRDELATELRERSRTFELLEEVTSDPEADILLGALEDIVCAMSHRGEAWRREQVRAFGFLREITSAARLAGLSMDDCIPLLKKAAVPVSRVSGADLAREDARLECPDDAPQVVFCDYTAAAAAAGSPCALVVMADLTSAAFPASDAESASATLLGKFGIARADDALSRMRRSFAALCARPSHELFIVRCLNDSDAEPTYPAAVLEEFVDCYRPDPSATDDIDNVYALPPALLDDIVGRGEERLVENAAVGASTGAPSVRIEFPQAGRVSDKARDSVVLPRVVGKKVVTRPCLSPSQIESYLECPYKWFAQRRLRLEGLDEGFGALQKGDFAHGALKSFYTHFQEEVAPKVTHATLGEAHRIMAGVIERHLGYQYDMKPTDNRLLPLTAFEQREVDELARMLQNYLPFEAELLPSFHPAHLEYDVAQGSTAPYAGIELIGTADRIDVDDAGHAVVLDYKASVSPAYEYAMRAETGCGKVQALIYAQIVRRTLGVDVVGALYVRYGKTCSATGAYDARFLEAPHLPRMRHERCEVPPASGLSFSDVLDRIEEAVARGVERMLAGDVRPNPCGAYACAYCPVLSCPERIS